MKKAIAIVAIGIACLFLYLQMDNQIGPNAPKLAPQPVANEYGTAPRNITDIMAGDGAALTREVNEQHRQQPAPILTERRR
jgi:hypothetical protein